VSDTPPPFPCPRSSLSTWVHSALRSRSTQNSGPVVYLTVKSHVDPFHFPLPWTWTFATPPSVCETSITSNFMFVFQNPPPFRLQGTVTLTLSVIIKTGLSSKHPNRFWSGLGLRDLLVGSEEWYTFGGRFSRVRLICHVTVTKVLVRSLPWWEDGGGLSFTRDHHVTHSTKLLLWPGDPT
jgi:hypothetical protein